MADRDTIPRFECGQEKSSEFIRILCFSLQAGLIDFKTKYLSLSSLLFVKSFYSSVSIELLKLRKKSSIIISFLNLIPFSSIQIYDAFYVSSRNLSSYSSHCPSLSTILEHFPPRSTGNVTLPLIIYLEQLLLCLFLLSDYTWD